MHNEEEVFCQKFIDGCMMCHFGCQFCNYGYIPKSLAEQIKKEEREKNNGGEG